MLVFAAYVVTIVAVVAVVIADMRHRGRDEEQFRARGVVERVRAARGVLVHPCSYGGDLMEYPVHDGFDEDDVLATLAEIEAL
jgi:hypothetical protein